MDASRLDKMEEMLSTLISMVGNLKDKQNKMDTGIDKLQNDQSLMRDEIMAKLTDMQADQDHIWEKAARNERELAKLKSHLQL
jgi:predicted  nucleic acid-binding Zn-ribbon protein